MSILCVSGLSRLRATAWVIVLSTIDALANTAEILLGVLQQNDEGSGRAQVLIQITQPENRLYQVAAGKLSPPPYDARQ